ncbi:tetratricopeptide repeat protein [Psychrilyobacter sp.]|uniref:tetratricopeptide repeat protein n=1 Tax=Psychrilyobacter sp. TaxID=2586924 RepID=UPI00301817A9
MFLSPEEKLIKLRKKYKITQKELVGKEISRVFLGMIEVGKRGFTKKTGKILCENMNNILISRGIEDRINFDYLMESKEEQSKKYLVELTENIDNTSLINSLWDVDQAIFELNMTEKRWWDIKIGDILRDTKDRLEARKYYKDSLIGNLDIKMVKEQILEIARLNYYLNDFKDTILTVNKLKVQILEDKTDLTLKIMYNYAYAFYKEKDYDNALKEFKDLLRRFKDNELEFNIKNMIGVCYEQIGEFNKGIEYYEKLKKGRKKEEKIIILGNLLSIAIKRDDKNYLNEIYQKIKQLFLTTLESNDIFNFELTLILARGAKALGELKESKKYYLQLFSEEEHLNFKNKSKLEAMSELLRILTKEDYLTVKGLELKYFNLIKKEKNCYVILEFINYYQENNYRIDLNSILNNSLKTFSVDNL